VVSGDPVGEVVWADPADDRDGPDVPGGRDDRDDRDDFALVLRFPRDCFFPRTCSISVRSTGEPAPRVQGTQ
jgi:hypothetical protein